MASVSAADMTVHHSGEHDMSTISPRLIRSTIRNLLLSGLVILVWSLITAGHTRTAVFIALFISLEIISRRLARMATP